MREKLVRSLEKNTFSIKNKNVFLHIPNSFSKTLPKSFCRCQNICSHNPIKNILWDERYQMSSAHEKGKIEGFSEKFSSKCGSFPLKVQNWKKIVSEILPKRCSAHVFYRVEKTAGSFLPNLREKMLNCREKNLSNQKEHERSVPHLECTFENLVESFSAEAWRFKLTFPKKACIFRENVPKRPLHTKNEKLR